jgi:hypothetical protein
VKRDEALAILGLPPAATVIEINQAHHDLVRKWHPDRFQGEPARQAKAERRFKEITEAFQTLVSERHRFEAMARNAEAAATRVPPPSSTHLVRYAPHEHWTKRQSQAHSREQKPSARRTPGPGLWQRLSGSRVAWLVVLIGIGGAGWLLKPKAPAQYGALAVPSRQGAGIDASPAGRRSARSDSSSRTAPGRGHTSTTRTGGATGPVPPDHAASSPTTRAAGLTLNSRPSGATSSLGTEPGRPDLRALSMEERTAVESACLHARLEEGAAGYHRCLGEQMAEILAGPRRPDLSLWDEEEREAMLSACAHTRTTGGPAAYNRCLAEQVIQLATTPRPSLTALSSEERDGIESACAATRRNDGAAAYNRCLTDQLAQLSVERGRPDLSSLSAEERASVESTCLDARLTEGAAAYDRCLVREVSRRKGGP